MHIGKTHTEILSTHYIGVNYIAEKTQHQYPRIQFATACKSIKNAALSIILRGCASAKDFFFIISSGSCMQDFILLFFFHFLRGDKQVFEFNDIKTPRDK